VSTGTQAFAGSFGLSQAEIRVLGCLLEKQRTTPAMYPLTLNALRLACNQSTNREPVLDYDEQPIRDALHRLERRGFARLASGRSSRAPKYRHLLAEALPMGEDEQAVLCVLMLRGAQTPGELKQRAERMHSFGDLSHVHDTLARLIERGLAARLERRPGQKEERYAQTLEDRDAPRASGGEDRDRASAPVLLGDGGRDPRWAAAGGDLEVGALEVGVGAIPDLQERIARLEREVAELRTALGAGVGGKEPAGVGFAGQTTAGDPQSREWP